MVLKEEKIAARKEEGNKDMAEGWAKMKSAFSGKSNEEKTDLRTLLAVSPKYFLNKENSNPLINLRIIGDTCFR